jgi:hypothetical protein
MGTRTQTSAALARLCACLALLAACGCVDGADAGGDLAPDAGGDTDSDADGDADGDSDSDADLLWVDALDDCDFPASDGCYPGDFLMDDPGDLSDIEGYPCISGTLLITGSELEDVQLPLLSKGCYFGVQDATSLHSLSLPALERVEHDFMVSHLSELSSFDATSLSEVGGYVRFYQLGAMTTLSGLPQLSSAGNVSIHSSGSVEVVELPSLEQVEEDLDVTYNDVLEAFRAPKLQRVANLRVYRNDALTELSLPAMEIVEGNIEMDRDLMLEDLDLSTLREVVGGVYVSVLSELKSLTGFASLEDIGGGLYLQRLEALESLEGLSMLSSVDCLYVSDCASLATLDGLSSLETVSGDFSIELNGALTSVGDLPSLTSIDGDLNIHGSPHLEDVSGLASLESLGGWLGIHGAEISDVSAFYGLTWFGGDAAGFSYCPHLPTCEAEALFEYFASIGWEGEGIAFGDGIDECATPAPGECGDVVHDGDVTAWSAEQLADLEGVTRIDGNLSLTGLDDVADLSALSELRCISGDVSIGDVALDDLAGLESLWFVGGAMSIGSNGIGSLEGLPGLSYAGALWIGGQYALTSLSGLANLTAIGVGGLFLSETGLQYLSGLESLSSIEGSLHIHKNCDLLMLDGLGGLEYLGGDIWIAYNADLAPGQAEDLMAQLVDAGWTGTADIDEATSDEECSE